MWTMRCHSIQPGHHCKRVSSCIHVPVDRDEAPVLVDYHGAGAGREARDRQNITERRGTGGEWCERRVDQGWEAGSIDSSRACHIWSTPICASYIAGAIPSNPAEWLTPGQRNKYSFI